MTILQMSMRLHGCTKYSMVTTKRSSSTLHTLILQEKRIYLFFDVIHLFKNIRKNLINLKKFVFPLFQFDLFHDAIHVPDCYISWSIFHEVHERDENLQAHLRKAPKITYQVTHPGNNKQQSVLLPLAIFQESTTAAIKSYFPNRLDAANFLTLFYKVFVICNLKQRFNAASQPGNAVIQGDHKPEFLLLVIYWVDTWSKCPSFTLTKQTSHALFPTLRCIANLIDDLLNENYDYILMSRFQIPLPHKTSFQ